MIKYYLMHKDNVCGLILFDEATGRIAGYKDHHTGFSPYMGNVDLQKIIKWWEMRAVPASRTMIQEVIKKSGCLNAEMYLAKNLALSMTDTYWVCPAGSDLKYENVKFSNLSIYNEGKIPYHNATSYDYNASLGGRMEKYWDLDQPTPVLVKESSKYYGQQSVNEVLATKIHTMQGTDVPFVEYTAEIVDGRGIISRCNAFTSEHVELISAYEMIESQKPRNETALYDHYIDMCVKNGIDRDQIQKFMDYQTLTDFIISNTDEHLMNFGVLRDADTMKLIGPAPIFDSGNSMFYSDERLGPYSRVELLERNITSFYTHEDRMLAKVKDRHVVKLDLLPEPKEIKELLCSAGIPEVKAEFIQKNYGLKLQMIKEFQLGKTISLYHEKEQERQVEQKKRSIVTQSQNALLVMCGLPGSGKTEKADELLKTMQREGKRLVKVNNLYSVPEAMRDTAFLINRANIMNKLQKCDGYEKTVTLISANDIRKEIEDQGFRCTNDLVFIIAAARTKAALENGTTVIYDASNITKEARKRLLEIAKDSHVNDTQLYVMNTKDTSAVSKIAPERMETLRQLFVRDYPEKAEGWAQIIECVPEIVKSATTHYPNDVHEQEADEWER